MPVRTAYAGAAVAGEVLTAANVNKMPGGWIGYAEVTANQTGISVITDLTGLSVTVTVGSSRRIRVTGVTQHSTNAVNQGIVRILEGATILTAANYTSAAIGNTFAFHAGVVLTPTAGSHTYKLALEFSTGSGDLIAAANQPAYILCEDLGPAA